MSLPLPKSGFEWKRAMPTEEQIMKMKESSKKGWILEVDLEYSEELHEENNSYPLAPEKKAITPKQMSEYQKRLMAELNLDPLTGADVGRQRKVRAPLQKPAVLPQTGHAPEKGAQGDRVRPRALDGAVHPDEHRVPEAGEKRLRDQLLQADEQLRVQQNDRKPEEPRGCENRAELGDRQDTKIGSRPFICRV